ncbi:amidohydrolase [Actinokineospora bangkokensis]|uniref:Peptidase M20 domain-containing protein 2 n=1 Tax=Actinokineospora bangkokensis TaxID=1193682 RepID=A0A1Q9LMR1_9PSEU|nr:amidohydrolase [Actinokineospora bangkokensis]OLR93318.1 amidohydrolase [Actinokineospora bangkokensis]
MPTPDDPHQSITRRVADLADEVWATACALHADPECAFDEHRAAALLSTALERGGYGVRRGVAGMPTAFTGEAGSGGPSVALLMEYDALPGMGHACGHNLIAAAGLGAALAVRPLLDRVPGRVLAVGSPAEEGGGGKVAEVRAGVFDGVDAALMVHPGVHSWSWAPLTAQVELEVVFHGRAAHPTGNPAEGRDALAALVQLYTTLGALRPHLPPGAHVQGIITEGGVATNVVPDRAVGRFGLRAATTTALRGLVDRVEEAARSMAWVTETTVEVHALREPYAHFRRNEALADRFAEHLPFALALPTPGVQLGSSDMGNVSVEVPAIHPFLAITGPGGSDHTPEFARAAAGPRAREVVLAAAEALAHTAADVLLDDGLRERAWAEFRERGRVEA